ncbi:MAG: response regulator [Deltaproteobacteria bacterium]|nr:response regulator [Deltaproteobacteria bacterium]
MPLRLVYPDKYRLWDDLVRGNTDRVFVETLDKPQLRSTVSVELALPNLAVPIVIRGTVVGRRAQSQKFAAGVYLRFEDREIQKCRRFLGLAQTPERYEHARKTRRVHDELRVRFVRPELGTPGITKNVSESGLFVMYHGGLAVGQIVEVALTLDDGEDLPLRAEVSWVDEEQKSAGLRFVDVASDASERLGACIMRLTEKQARAQSREKVPVVVADDDPIILEFLTSALTRFGFEVFQVSNGELALGLIRDLQPRLVLLDILMPGIDGMDICKMMRSDAYLVDIPVVFVSALDPERLHVVADEAGATDYLVKPVQLGDLFNLVGAYLKR